MPEFKRALCFNGICSRTNLSQNCPYRLCSISGMRILIFFPLQIVENSINIIFYEKLGSKKWTHHHGGICGVSDSDVRPDYQLHRYRPPRLKKDERHINLNKRDWASRNNEESSLLMALSICHKKLYSSCSPLAKKNL